MPSTQSLQVGPQNREFHAVTPNTAVVELHKMDVRAEDPKQPNHWTGVPKVATFRVLHTLQKTRFLSGLKDFSDQSVELICI